jgi:hypothetical protein
MEVQVCVRNNDVLGVMVSVSQSRLQEMKVFTRLLQNPKHNQIITCTVIGTGLYKTIQYLKYGLIAFQPLSDQRERVLLELTTLAVTYRAPTDIETLLALLKRSYDT